jgi:acyl carrier protein
MTKTETTFNDVKNVLAKTLGIEDRLESLTPATPLLDSLPELDSMAVLNVMLAIEQRFGVTIDDDEVTGELFATLGTLSAFVEQKLKTTGE